MVRVTVTFRIENVVIVILVVALLPTRGRGHFFPLYYIITMTCLFYAGAEKPSKSLIFFFMHLEWDVLREPDVVGEQLHLWVKQGGLF